MTPALRADAALSVQVVTNDGAILSGGMAVAFVLETIGYPRLGRLMRSRLLSPLVEWGYRRVANNRDFFGRLIFGKKCAKP